jgi:heme/copper-type cytochrome/quinol oxidase subunit 2
MFLSMKKNFAAVIGLVVVLVPALFLALPALAQTPIETGMLYAENFELASSDQDPRDAAINIVRYLMTFLGIIAVVIILYGGFMWMTAAGNEDRVASAKKIISAGAIGLVVILAAFFIVTFVIQTTSGLLANGEIN